MWANFILINADAFFLAHIYYLEPILAKITGAISVHKAALSNKVLAHVSTGAPKVPLCLQEALKLLIAFCANGPFVFYQVLGNLGMPRVTFPLNSQVFIIFTFRLIALQYLRQEIWCVILAIFNLK